MSVPIEDKVKIASKFLLASPPGEVNDVFNDVRTLVDNDEALQDGILQALEQYNTEQLITVTLPESDYEVIVSNHGKVDEERFIDPRSKQSFKFDHMRLVASDLQPHEGHASVEPLREAIEKEALTYVQDHYPEGVCTVYAPTEYQVAIAIVDNKYNPGNYWNGRWLSTWTLDTQTGELKGATKINVHYYEDGNVQLNADKYHEAKVSISEVKNPCRCSSFSMSISLIVFCYI
ncbi:F-actin-capping protein subunit alpha [Zychaea mexicana]|uniref:F-actin-capping protein subunit alpha n=1 Tax=Zychaea mexicana TaxID=64656 RepID=UPI0022FF1CB4|nr:F-actin-capping protein subunit alpha [Zychaea mexicana]KAI9478919.1 F-actin-capping protein subunit alpha [Zychaea mexicana]